MNDRKEFDFPIELIQRILINSDGQVCNKYTYVCTYNIYEQIDRHTRAVERIFQEDCET